MYDTDDTDSRIISFLLNVFVPFEPTSVNALKVYCPAIILRGIPLGENALGSKEKLNFIPFCQYATAIVLFLIEESSYSIQVV